jgi:hypothetical protein
MLTRNNTDELNYQRRREWVFLLLAGIFLGSLTMLNILGISRFIDLSDLIGLDSNNDIRFVVGLVFYLIQSPFSVQT